MKGTFCRTYSEHGIQLAKKREYTWEELVACAMTEYDSVLTVHYAVYFKAIGFTDATELVNFTMATPEVSFCL